MLRSTTVNGIPALWTDGPAPYTAALVFGSGATDETLRTSGVAHLVEHLVMAAQGRTALDVNAMVDDVTTVFHASGDRRAVAEWLAGVCAAVRDLPLDRLATEVKVLDAEEGTSAHPALGWAAAIRFGATGVGLLGHEGAPHRTLTPQHVADFARRHLTAGNAVVVSTGEPPQHPGITLPAGPRPARDTAVDVAPELPAYVHGPPLPVVSWVSERGAAAHVLLDLVADLLTDDLRHREGLVYEVGSDAVQVSPGVRLAALWADVAETDQARVITRAVNLLRQLASHGPEAGDLEHRKAVARNQLSDPRATADFLVHAAGRHLEGRPVHGVEDLVAEIEAVTAEHVREAATAALPTLLVGGSISRSVGIVGIPDRTDDRVPDCPAFEGRRWKRKLVSLAPRDLRLDLNDEGLAQTVLGERHGGRWSDVVGVARGPDFRAVVFRDGDELVVWPGSLKDGDAAAAAIDRHAGDLLFEVDEEWLDDDEE